MSPQEPRGQWLSRAGCHACSLPALWCQRGQMSLGCRWGGRGCPQGAGMEEVWVRMGAVVGTQARGRVSPGCRQRSGGWGLRCCPVATLTAAPGPKVPSCVTAVLPQASRGCLLCSFGARSALTQLTVFPSAGAVAHAAGGARRGWHRRCCHQSPGHPLASPRHHRGSWGGHRAPRAPHGHHSCGGALRAPEPLLPHGTGSAGLRESPWRCPAPAPAKGHKSETPRKLPAPKAALALLSLSRWLVLGDL